MAPALPAVRTVDGGGDGASSHRAGELTLVRLRLEGVAVDLDFLADDVGGGRG